MSAMSLTAPEGGGPAKTRRRPHELLVLGNGSAFAQNTKATLEDHENRITDLEGDVQALDGRVTALEGNGNGNGQGGPFVFDGYSTATVLGDVGVTGLTDACNPARVCTTKEFMLSTDIAAPGADAWILSKIVDVTSFEGQATQCIDFSGVSRDCEKAACRGWTSAGSLEAGSVVTTAGGISSGNCSVPHPVTCCAPAQ